jgi:hypothetical protein
MDKEVILIGHSFGGSVLLKYLAEDSYRSPSGACSLSRSPTGGQTAGRTTNTQHQTTLARGCVVYCWLGGFFLLRGVLLALFPLPDLTAEAARQPRPDRMLGRHAGLHRQYSRRGRHRLRRRRGGRCDSSGRPTDRSWGGRSAFMADPEGNRWEITWSPRATFDACGAPLSWD